MPYGTIRLSQEVINSYYAGIDEAGRGPVIGPLVMSCIVLDNESLESLKILGVKDSKKLTPLKRKHLFKNIANISHEIIVKIIDPLEIDDAVYGRTVRNLNELEAKSIAEMISFLKTPVSKIFIDAPDQNTDRFKLLIKKHFPRLGKYAIVAKNKADIKYPIVSAASIVSKVIRDTLIAKLKREYGDFGSGYPSDIKTRKFLLEWYRKYGTFPPIVRKSWKTLENIIRENKDVYLKF